MEGLALVVGSGGIGRQIAEDLASKDNNLKVILCGRKNVFKNFWELDIENENSLKDLKDKLSKSKSNLRLVLNATEDYIAKSLILRKDCSILIKKI